MLVKVDNSLMISAGEKKIAVMQRHPKIFPKLIVLVKEKYAATRKKAPLLYVYLSFSFMHIFI